MRIKRVETYPDAERAILEGVDIVVFKHMDPEVDQEGGYTGKYKDWCHVFVLSQETADSITLRLRWPVVNPMFGATCFLVHRDEYDTALLIQGVLGNLEVVGSHLLSAFLRFQGSLEAAH